MTDLIPNLFRCDPDREVFAPAFPVPSTPEPRRGEPCTLAQLKEHICDEAYLCPFAEPCAAQPLDAHARCLRIDRIENGRT